MKKKIYATLDRIEGQKAVLLTESEDIIELPRGLLPEGCSEGDMLSVSMKTEDGKTRAKKEEVKGLISKLSGRK